MISEEKRKLIIDLRTTGKTEEEIANILSTSQSTVSYWIIRHKATGSVKSKEKSGRPARLSASQAENLKAALHRKPLERYGGKSFGWTTKLARKFISDEYGITYGIRRVQKLMHKFGLSKITPRPEHMKASKTARDNFKRNFKKNSKEPIWAP